jgi:hypothetical protein
LRIKLQKENNRLVALVPDHPKIYPDAETEEDFYIKGVFLFIHFEKDRTGKVTGFRMHQYAGDTFVKKIN